MLLRQRRDHTRPTNGRSRAEDETDTPSAGCGSPCSRGRGDAAVNAVKPHAELRVTGDDVSATVALFSPQFEVLVAGLAEGSLREWDED